MSLKNLEKVLGEDLYKTIAEKFEGKDWFFAEGKDFIPKSRLDEVNAQKKELEAQIAKRDSQLAEIQKQVKGNDELTKQIQTLQEENQKTKEAYETKLLNLQKETVLNEKLSQSGARNAKALKGMIDLSACEFKNGVYEGLDEQIAKIRKDNDWLFTQAAPTRIGNGEGKASSNNVFEDLARKAMGLNKK